MQSRLTAYATGLLFCISTVSAATISVGAGGDFQAALNNARSGDIITLAAGATFNGPFELPANSGSGYITIRTSAADSSLPAAGVRITPASASLLPKLVADGAGGLPVIRTVPGSSHYKFLGIEISPTAGTYLLQLVRLGEGNETSLSQLPGDFVFDRCYLHGDPKLGARRGVAMNASNITIENSYLSDFKVVGPDSQALASWNGPGPLTITNNYLEAAGENVLIGGQDPTIPNLVPSGITIRQNHFSKPLSWRMDSSTYEGTHWTVKNLLEFKNAQHIVVDGNLFENNWRDAQSGFAILFTPRNQDGNAPWSVVSDAEFTNNIVRHVGSAINILGSDDIYSSQQLHDITIRNNLFDDISPQWGGTARLLQVLNDGLNITFDHNTSFSSGAILVADQAPSTGLRFTNNLVSRGSQGVFGSGVAEGAPSLASYFPGAVFLRNAIIGASDGTYPSGNLFPAGINDVGFVDYSAGDYRLLAGSPFHNAATDGSDIGANLNASNAPPPPIEPGPGGIVNAATFDTAIGAGSIVSLFGTNLAGTTASASTYPLPRQLAGTQVLVNGTPVPLFYVSPAQINLQLPTGLSGDLSLSVVSGTRAGVNSRLTVLPEAPSIFMGTQTQGAIVNQDFSFNSTANPALAGSVIQIFATGLGETNPPLPTGEAASMQPPYNVTVNPVTVWIDGQRADVQFSGAAPGFAGLFQINAIVPRSGLQGNSVPVRIQVNGKQSNTVTLATRP